MRLVLVLLAGCGRIGFDPGSAATDAATDAFDDSRCTWGAPVALDDLNTDDSESEPALSPDGRHLVFISDRGPGAAGRVYVAERTATGWGSPALIPAFDSNAGDSGPSWNASGTRLYYTSFRAGPLRIYQASFDGSTFGAPSLVPGLELLDESISPTVRTDELEMFFSSRLPPSRIEYATRASTSASWISQGDVDELVAPIDHGYPGISPDGRTLYFEVQRTGGFFISRARRPSIDAPFGPVEAVAELDGPGSHGDAQPSFDGTELYLSSDRGEPGNFDLYVSQRVCE